MESKTTKDVNIDLSKTTPVLCVCGHNIYTEGLKLNKVSALLSPTGKEELLTLPVLFCAKCGKEFSRKDA